MRPRGRPRLVLDEEAIVATHLVGDSVTEIARNLGVDRCVIRRVLNEAGVTPRDDRGAHWADKRERSDAA